MIPILYETGEKQFKTNGIGRLSDAVSCYVTEERNGQYELEMQYPVTGIHYEDLLEEKLIIALPSEGAEAQPFRIYRITRPLDGIITVYAQHISYMLKQMVVMPFQAGTPAEAMLQIESKIIGENPFSFWTDKTTKGTMKLSVPTGCRSLLGGIEGSVLDAFSGGEYEFDRFEVKLHENRGADNGASIRYGKNLTGLESDLDNSGTYTAIVPYWKKEDETIIGDRVESEHISDYGYEKCIAMDFSQDFEDAPTKEQLQDAAKSYMDRNITWAPSSSVDVSFQPLWQSQEYENIAQMERVKLCDTVTVEYENLGVSVKAKVITTEYDVLAERYTSIELGDARHTLAEKISEPLKEMDEKIAEQETWMRDAITMASNLISGGLGGHVIIKRNADGKPEEIIIMDTEDIATSQKVWRWNMGGLGYSSTGYNGEFGTAITMDGEIVADWIKTGILQANLIKAGILSDKTGRNFWNMETGELQLSGTFANYTPEGIKSVEIRNNQARFYAWNDDGNYVGSIGAIKKRDSDRVGVTVWCDQGDLVELGYNDGESDTHVMPVISFDSSKLDQTPYIINAANGTVNMLGHIHLNENHAIDLYHRRYLTVSNGLITDWYTIEFTWNPDTGTWDERRI